MCVDDLRGTLTNQRVQAESEEAVVDEQPQVEEQLQVEEQPQVEQEMEEVRFACVADCLSQGTSRKLDLNHRSPMSPQSPRLGLGAPPPPTTETPRGR